MADITRFLRDVRDHRMTIELDQGVHRSVLFKRPGSSHYHYRLNTWPGHLSISGDCCSYTFALMRDMFDFFRYAGPDYERDDYVNISYWSGKLRAADKNGCIEVFDEDAYRTAIKTELDMYIEQFDDDARAIIDRDVEIESLLEPSDTLEASVEKAMRWQCPISGEKPFSDFYDYRLTKTSYHLIWCMRAIQWGIKRYDLHHQGRTQADHDRRVLAGMR